MTLTPVFKSVMRSRDSVPNSTISVSAVWEYDKAKSCQFADSCNKLFMTCWPWWRLGSDQGWYVHKNVVYRVLYFCVNICTFCCIALTKDARFSYVHLNRHTFASTVCAGTYFYFRNTVASYVMIINCVLQASLQIHEFACPQGKGRGARHEGTCGSGGIYPPVINLFTTRIWVVRFTRRPLYRRGTCPGANWTGNWLCPGVALDALHNIKTSCPTGNWTTTPRSSSL